MWNCLAEITPSYLGSQCISASPVLLAAGPFVRLCREFFLFLPLQVRTEALHSSALWPQKLSSWKTKSSAVVSLSPTLFRRRSKSILFEPFFLLAGLGCFRRVLHSFIHSGYFCSASSSPLLLRGAPDTARILCIGVSRRSATGTL